MNIDAYSTYSFAQLHIDLNFLFPPMKKGQRRYAWAFASSLMHAL